MSILFETSHPRTEELQDLYSTKRQLEGMVQRVINDEARDLLLDALHGVKSQILKIKNEI